MRVHDAFVENHQLIGQTGRALRDARSRARFTQAQVARRTGVPVSVISAYENGRREPGVRVFRELLHACGADLTLTNRWDSARNSRHFEAVMEMTDHLPKGVRGDLSFPPFARAAPR